VASCLVPPQRDAVFVLDRLAAVMLTLVTGVASVVHAFAVRYMDGDPGFARFFAWLGIVTASVLVVVMANDLVLLALGWIGVSRALYALQTHYRDRPAAIAAAAPMRRAHLLGDGALAIGFVVLALAGRTTRIDALLAQAPTLAHGVVVGVVLLVTLAAFSKSAQLGMHGWLPDTMEAPTPVSALMHAGIVNAGGFLLARFAPLLAHASDVAWAIVVIGFMTALWGAACMLVRSDVKRGLAYSTMSQMGYMTAQCGFGAFPAAVLHLTAHGLYKATLFLGSGYAVHDAKRAQRAPLPAERRTLAGALAAAILAPAAALITYGVLGRALPPYGWVLLAFAALTVAQAVFAIVVRGRIVEFVSAAALVAVALPAYALAVIGFDRFLSRDVEAGTLLVAPWLLAVMLAVFALMLLLGWGAIRVPMRLRDRAYVALLNERLPLGARS
jgi:NADH-quinone oxidoreductase subunit L